MKDALKVLKAQQTWRLIEVAEALGNARVRHADAEQAHQSAQRIRESIQTELARYETPGAALNPAALQWLGADLLQQCARVAAAAHAESQAAQAHEQERQTLASVRLGEKKLEAQLQRVQREESAEKGKHALQQLDELWLQSLHRNTSSTGQPT